jgi:HTH-type transcriptional regulator, sugar sensing transcriptional regulator
MCRKNLTSLEIGCIIKVDKLGGFDTPLAALSATTSPNLGEDNYKIMDQKMLLNEIGLSDKEAEIYQILLRIGVAPAKKVVLEANMPRGTVYEILEQLTKKQLLEQFQNEKNITVFRVRHPYALKEFIESQKEKISQTEVKLDSLFADFVNLYSQSQNRPGVKFYEGIEGVKKVLWDTLNSKTEILTIADIEAIKKYIYDINEEYVKQRNKKAIPKRLLVQDTPYARERQKNYSEITHSKLFKLDINPFNTMMQIYDNKIAYITMTENFFISIIIEDSFLYSMHKALFNSIWENTPI